MSRRWCGADSDSRASCYLGALEIFADRPGRGQGGGRAAGERGRKEPPPGPVLADQVRAGAPAQPAQHAQSVRQPTQLRVSVQQPWALRSKAEPTSGLSAM